MKDFFKTTLAVIVGIFATFLVMSFLMGISIGIIASMGDEEVEVEPNTVLHIKLNETISDRSTESFPSFANFQNLSDLKTLGLNDIIKNIRKAKNDENIKGIYLDLTSISAGISTIEEIRNALIEFKESGKFIIAHADYYSHATYYIASTADKIYMTPTGAVTFVGLSSEVMYFKTAFEKIGVEPQIIRHGKFKSAVEPFMQDKMSPANYEQISTYTGSIWNELLDDISKSRNIQVAELNRMADEMLITNDTTCITHKLVDSLFYKDQVIAELKKLSGIEADKKLKTIALGKYTGVPEVKVDKDFKLAKDRIAVIYATGQIDMGEGDDMTIGSERLSAAIKTAREDKNIKAIVLRINSPGGSALASEIILREALLAHKEKPFIVSMGDLAASGGYYIACAADTIVAQPTTLTGSIGVFGLMFNAKKLLNEKIGINIETVNTNKHSDVGSMFRPLTDEERNMIQKSVEDIYTTFITHVANARNMTTAQVDSIGQGRVWSGINAKEIGLVDEIGGLDRAIQIAAEKAKLENYRIVELPEIKKTFDVLMEQLEGNVSERFIKNRLGENYKFLKMTDELQKINGIQARMLFYIDIH